MKQFTDQRQRLSRGELAPRLLLAAGCTTLIVILTAIAFIDRDAPLPEIQPRQTKAPAADIIITPTHSADTGSPSFEHPESTPVSPPSASLPPEPSIAELERNYRKETDKEARLEIARQIAGENNAESVHALARLFQYERNPDIRTEIIGALDDVRADVVPEARFNMLSAAVGLQPRNVRMAALSSLASIEEPHVTLLIRKIATSDSDKLMREFASKLLE